MDLAIVHYHLNRGGVTQVVRNHLLSLDAADSNVRRVRLIRGPGRAGWPEEFSAQLKSIELEEVEVAGLAYDQGGPPQDEALAAAITSALSGLDRADCVVHVHNHNLGKNVSLPGALRRLAADGWPLLLQIHDFAEDFRPDNFARLVASLSPGQPQRLGEQLYPQAENIHYAVLNGRDRGVLQASGIAQPRLHWLPNPVGEFGNLPAKNAARTKLAERFGVPVDARLALYPVRGIGRKNLGEMLLWAAAGRGRLWAATTLAPLNPIELPQYGGWVELARRLQLPVAFDTGGEGGLEFLENLAAADIMLTTSVAEGFGMVFLESWLAGKNLAGRDLPEITADFVGAGLQFPGLADRLDVPIDWVGRERFADAMLRRFAEVACQYGQPLSLKAWRGEIDQLAGGDHIDFAVLTPQLQARVIERVAADPTAAADVCAGNSVVSSALLGEGSTEPLIDANADQVRTSFSYHAIADRLQAAYAALLQGQIAAVGRIEPASEPGLAKPDAILSRFLSLDRFNPLRLPDNAQQQRQQRISELSQPLLPQPTGVEPRLQPLASVSTVLFDIYGTLLVSGSGDVGVAKELAKAEAFVEAITSAGGDFDATTIDGEAGSQRLLDEIQRRHAELGSDGVEHPEVEIDEIWRRTIVGMIAESCLPPEAVLLDPARLALEYELRVNPSWPMPEMVATLRRLQQAGMKLGIISNAQFFTPEILAELAGRSTDELGFDTRLCFYSFQHQCAKPGEFLYRLAAKRLAEQGVSPESVLYVGNDMLNDMTPAAAVGFRTALFAGDARSLRRREDDPRVAGVTPDLVVTELTQLLDCVEPRNV